MLTVYSSSESLKLTLKVQNIQMINDIDVIKMLIIVKNFHLYLLVYSRARIVCHSNFTIILKYG